MSFKDYIASKREYVFGQFNETPTVTTARDLERLILEGRKRVPQLSSFPLEYIISRLHTAGMGWEEHAGEFCPYHEITLEYLTAALGMSESMARQSLELLPRLLDRHALFNRLRSSLPYPVEVLDRWYKPSGFDGQVRALPRGVVFHICAGNVFLGAIDTLVMGLLTKNINIVKLSRNDPFTPLLFALSLKIFSEEMGLDHHDMLTSSFSILNWKGGTEDIESVAARHADCVVVWGGDEAVKSWRQKAGPGTKVVGFGPKISFGVLSREGLAYYTPREAAKRFARDIALWDQSACASPQNIFVESTIPRDLLQAFIRCLSEELAVLATELPPGETDIDQAAEITKQREFYRFKAAVGDAMIAFSEGDHTYTVVYDTEEELTPSPLGRFIILKPYSNRSELARRIRIYWHYLQTAGLLTAPGEWPDYRQDLTAAGVNRLSEAGGMLKVVDGAPHDGTLPLAELLRWVNAETPSFGRPDLHHMRSHLEFIREESELYGEKWSASNLESPDPLATIPVLTQREFLENSLPASHALLTGQQTEAPIIFATGGSTGKPKFSCYTHSEFDLIASALADNYLFNGVTRHDTIANLFVAGHLWSSFLAVDRAINKIGATNLPIGGQTDEKNILTYLQLFCPTVIMGLPSQLAELARLCKKYNLRFSVRLVFYAGEEMTETARNQLQSTWNVEHCKSAGYASVDAGPIGYQCPHQEKGVHHLYSSLQVLEILDFDEDKRLVDGTVGEITVTNLFRRYMPFIRYRTGDQGVFLADHRCPCGRTDPVFKLLGRCDDRLQVGGARLNIKEIEPLLALHDYLTGVYQFVPYLKQGREHLSVLIETTSRKKSEKIKRNFERDFLSIFSDFRFSMEKGWIDMAEITFVKPGEIPRVQRTGKLKLIRDERTDA